MLRVLLVLVTTLLVSCHGWLMTSDYYIKYPVKSGDTIGQISDRFHVSEREIITLNSLGNPRRLRAGTYLRIPFRGQSLAKNSQDVASERARYSGVPKGGAVRLTKKESEHTRLVKLGPAGQYVGNLLWPVREGRAALTSQFGRRWLSFHEGIDFGVPIGTPVYATHSGQVVYSGDGLRGYGNLIVVRDPGRLVTVYAHNNRNRVRKGTWVKKGQHIADAGNTGKSTGPHVHYETRTFTRDGKLQAVDPLAFY